jgi:soluble lytic murein transglycosylase-like protein
VQAIFELLELSTRWLHATAAVLQLAPHPQMTPPRAAYYAACMVKAEQEYNMPWPRVAAIIQHESQWRPALVSQTNDYGLGQHHCPSFFCGRRPGPMVKAALLDGCTNIQLTAEELVRKRVHCKKKHGCKDYVKLYNPGNPTYADQIHRWEAKFRAAAKGPKQVRLAME